MSLGRTRVLERELENQRMCVHFLPSILKSSIIINALAVKSKVTVFLDEIFIFMQVFYFFFYLENSKVRTNDLQQKIEILRFYQMVLNNEQLLRQSSKFVYIRQVNRMESMGRKDKREECEQKLQMEGPKLGRKRRD